MHPVRLHLHTLVAATAIAVAASAAPAVADETSSDDVSVAVTGTAAVGRTLTASTTGLEAGAASFQWVEISEGLSEPVAIPGATSRTFTVSEDQWDDALAVRITWQDGTGLVSRDSASTLRVLRSDEPQVTGTLRVGGTVGVARGSWSSGTRHEFQWYSGGKKLAGRTSSRLTVGRSMADRTLSVRLTGRIDGYQPVSRTSAKTGRILTTATPRVVGAPALGRALRARPGTWTKGAKLSYRWYADGRAISATRSTYRPTKGTLAKRLTVRVRATKAGYEPTARSSGRTPRIQRIGKPHLGGSTAVSKKLTVSAGTWSSGTRFTYRWFIGGKKVATGKSVRVRSSWQGKRLTAKVTGRRSGFRTFTASTRRSGVVRLPNRTDPVSAWNCPSWAPIKGNADSGIYHVPGQRFYDRTKPEECFRTEAAARAAGYRKSKV